LPGPRITSGHVGTHADTDADADADADVDADAVAASSRVWWQPHREVDAGSEPIGGILGDGAANV